MAPALLLQAERLGVDEETLRYFAAVISSTIDGDGYVSAAGEKWAWLAASEKSPSFG